jgi:VIT1/CCC1 family predicted Fe2+/Mn2+ transporter
MLTEEYGLPSEVRSPWIAALSTFTAFLICGVVPLIPYLLATTGPLKLSIIMTGITFFAIGSVKSRWSTVSWWRSGMVTLAVGAIAAALAYAVGMLLRGWLPDVTTV